MYETFQWESEDDNFEVAKVLEKYVIATLSVYPHRESLKNMPGHGGIPPWPGIFFKLAWCGYTLRVAITYILFT